jgi:DNA-binding NarL/FixJ family response regulator
MKRRDEASLDRLCPPEGARAHELTVGGETLLVLSYPLDERDLLADAPLSSAELEVARLAVEGLSNAQIAERRATSVRTVANQMASILQKLRLSSRRQLAARYRRSGPAGS